MEHVQLMGSEDVHRAGIAMKHAAEAIQQAAASMDETARFHGEQLTQRIEVACRELGVSIDALAVELKQAREAK